MKKVRLEWNPEVVEKVEEKDGWTLIKLIEQPKKYGGFNDDYRRKRIDKNY